MYNIFVSNYKKGVATKMDSSIKLASNENILYQAIFKGDTSTKTAIKNGFSNFLFSPVVGKITDTYRSILTNKRLCLEVLDHTTFSDNPDILSTINIPIEEIKRFDIRNNTSNTKCYIELETTLKKTFNFYYELKEDTLDIPQEMKLSLNI